MAGVSIVNFHLLLFIFSVEGTLYCPRLIPPQGSEIQCSPSSNELKTNCSELSPPQTLVRVKCGAFFSSQGPKAYLMRCGLDGKWRAVRGHGNWNCHLDADEFVRRLVGSQRVLIFSRSTCSYCQETKRIFDHLGEKYMAVEVDHLEPYKVELLKGALWRKTGMRTWPNVFVKGRHVGGNDATKSAYRNGTLRRWLNTARTIGPERSF